ncbi:MAG: Fe-S cluster assembly protein SufD [Gammaproteobacteria bacterium]
MSTTLVEKQTTMTSDGYIQQLAHPQACEKVNIAGKNVSWLQERRQNATQSVASLGFPTRKQEAWKYTSVQHLAEHALHWPRHISYTTLPKEYQQMLLNITGPKLVFIDGYWQPDLSTDLASVVGLTVRDIASVLAAESTLLKPYIQQQTENQVFDALNIAAFINGSYIHVAAGTQVSQPVQLIYIATQADTTHAMRNIVLLEPETKLTLIEHYLGERHHSYFTNTVTQLYVNEGARLEHLKLIQESNNATHIGNIYATLQRDSHLSAHSCVLNGGLIRSDSEIYFTDKNSECALNGLFIAAGKQHVDQHTLLHHQASNTYSQQLYKGIATDKARGVFNGKIVIPQHAQHVNAQQHSKNLLLSNYAEINTKPELEIYADDVKCAHGATVGQLDQQALFYLQARGISESEAERLLLRAFANETINNIQHEMVRAEIQQVVTYHFPVHSSSQKGISA